MFFLKTAPLEFDCFCFKDNKRGQEWCHTLLILEPGKQAGGSLGVLEQHSLHSKVQTQVGLHSETLKTTSWDSMSTLHQV